MTEDQLRESILVADCGSTTTRVVLLDVVNGQYRFIASGETPSTGEPPWFDITIGLQRAIEEIETVTGRQIRDQGGRLLVPSRGEATGVDLFVATTSAAPALRTVLVGLMDDVSVASARRVALSTYTNIVDTLSLSDIRSEEEQIESLVEAEPDLFLIAGGTDGGSSDRVMQLVETVSIVPTLMGKRPSPPHVIFAGNSELRQAVSETLNETQLRTTDNVRPQVNVEFLEPAKAELNALFEETKLLELRGADDLSSLSDGKLVPTAKAFGWTVQYLGEILGRAKNIVGIDVGSASVTLGSVLYGRPQTTARGDLGIGHHLPRLLQLCRPEHILRWLPYDMTPSALTDFIINKALSPHTIPATQDELHLELALARELIRVVLPEAFPQRFGPGGAGMLPPLEMIFASGAVLANAPRPGQAALVMLDALQPTGLCTLAVDNQGLAPALGAVASVLPAAAIQVIESGAFRELGNIVAPVGRANPGEVILNLKMVYENGGELGVEVEFGALEVLPLPPGQQAELHLRPLKRFDVGAGPGRSYRRKVYGGVVGLIVDARGRPLRLPADPTERQTKMQQWLWDMGG